MTNGEIQADIVRQVHRRTQRPLIVRIVSGRRARVVLHGTDFLRTPRWLTCVLTVVACPTPTRLSSANEIRKRYAHSSDARRSRPPELSLGKSRQLSSFGRRIERVQGNTVISDGIGYG